MATAFIAYGVSRMVCREPIYRALAWSFLETQEPAKPTPEKPPAQRDTLV
jgi:hypothetical protein